jgi:hypothetical protein
MFSSEFLLSHKTVNELCYVAGFGNSIGKFQIRKFYMKTTIFKKMDKIKKV